MSDILTILNNVDDYHKAINTLEYYLRCIRQAAREIENLRKQLKEVSPPLTADESELIQWKATNAASTYSAGLLAADADCWPHVEGIWKDGWIKGYLTRKAEDRRAATGATS